MKPRTWFRCCCLVFASVAGGAAGAEIDFDACWWRTDNTNSKSLVVADFDGDGHVDVSMNYWETESGPWFSSQVLLTWGDGSGRHGSDLVAASIGSSKPLASIAADYTEDGHPDIVVGDVAGARVYLVASDGSRGFFVLGPFPVGARPRGLAAADFDGDGHIDLAVACGADVVTILGGDGAGGFASRRDVAVAGTPLSVAAADFDEDGHLDLVVGLQRGQSLAILRGDGALGFTLDATYGTGAKPIGLVAGDLDQDGHVDVAVAVRELGSVLVFRGDGVGWLGPYTAHAAGGGPLAIACGDMTGDGRPDLVATLPGAQSVALLRADGAGGFAPPNVARSGIKPVGLALADEDEDGRLDVFVLNVFALYQSTVTVHRTTATGEFITNLEFRAGNHPGPLASGDLDGDGIVDLAVGSIADRTVASALGDGTGRFASAGASLLPGTPTEAVAADMNSDGILDVAIGLSVGGLGKIGCLLGDGTGGLGPITISPRSGHRYGLVVADFDEDGLLDVAYSSDRSSVDVQLGDGTGGFRDLSDVELPSNTGPLAAADFDSDGHTDIVTHYILDEGLFRCNVAVLMGDGTGRFAPYREFYVYCDDPFIVPPVFVADVDRDGRLDIVILATSLVVLLGDGAGGFSASHVSLSLGYVKSVAIADFDEDGFVDLVTGGRRVRVIGGTGDPTSWTEFHSLGPDPYAGSIAVDDFDRDGHVDVATSSTGSDKVQVFLNGTFR